MRFYLNRQGNLSDNLNPFSLVGKTLFFHSNIMSSNLIMDILFNDSMIQAESQLKVVDNSGAKWAKCILVKKKGKHPVASIGMLILVSLRRFSSRKKVNKRIIYIGLIVGVSV
jgi:hypothetical protein